MASHRCRCLPRTNRRTWQEQSSHIVLLIYVSHFLCIQQRAEVVRDPNGSQMIFTEGPGSSSFQELLSSPELAHEVVISPGLPTPPLSPFRSAGLPYGEVKVCTEAGLTSTLRECSSLWLNDVSQVIDSVWNVVNHHCCSYNTEILVLYDICK